ncbi:mechanosensitive ion channel family protein [Sulfurimonas sp.]|uniref:mechanosensitive ion channel family protein n=1 Tax=Sulfurimonas sp. TaxID=2022749 RepID=UPI0026162005|nr:mechanosensitive ion channel family protein [Sulfurimonas sp.]MCW8895300.1 mechanosensitive ion channel family protein [Sulfurimonas sp.]MCW9067920.1 mechanosensitive ion channel family protein [Sulfurimonas sp.]
MPLEKISFIDSLESLKIVNEFLAPYGLSVFKIVIILALYLFIYFIRKVLFDVIESYISKIKSLNKYAKDILRSIRKLLEVMFIVINIELTLYVYNDFSTLNNYGIYFNMLYAFLITFIVYTTVNTIANIKLKEISVDDKKIKNEVINVSIKLINVLIWIIGALVVLHLAGVKLTAVVSGLGIGALAVALASKDSLANFFGTLSILFTDVFSQGDWIEVDGNQGTVVEIGLRVTKLRTFDNALIAIPNAVLANKDVKNWNKRSLGRRIKMHVGVKYDSKREDLQKAISEIYNMLDKHPGIATVNTKYSYEQSNRKTRAIVSIDDEEGIKKTLLVYLDEFGSSSINILIYCFSKSVKWQEWLEVKQDVMFKIMEILEKNSLEFAFPSLSVYHENGLDLPSTK